MDDIFDKIDKASRNFYKLNGKHATHIRLGKYSLQELKASPLRTSHVYYSLKSRSAKVAGMYILNGLDDESVVAEFHEEEMTENLTAHDFERK